VECQEGTSALQDGGVAFSYGGVAADGMGEDRDALVEMAHLEIYQGDEGGIVRHREVYQGGVEGIVHLPEVCLGDEEQTGPLGEEVVTGRHHWGDVGGIALHLRVCRVETCHLEEETENCPGVCQEIAGETDLPLEAS